MTYIALIAEHRHLRLVRKRLRHAGQTAYLPALVTKRIVPKGRRTRLRRRIIPLMSYILVKEPEACPSGFYDLWLHAVLETKGVRGYVTGHIPEASVEKVRAAVQDIITRAEAARHKWKLRRGLKARYTGDGPMRNKVGTIEWIKPHTIGLEMMLFGAERVVTVKRSDLEAA